MLSNLHAWLVAGSPAHFYLVLAGAYACACWVLSKYPKARANTVLEVVFNTLNPKVLPLLKLIPVAGPILAGFLDLFDSPKPASEMTPAEALEEVNRARRNAGRASVATMLWLAALVGLAGMFMACMSGCATVYTAPGATTAQKMKDDLSAISTVEADVKKQCGADFAPLAAQAMAVLSIAEAAGNAAAYNFGAAVQLAAAVFPVAAGDVQGLVCVYKVLKTDYQKLKPKAAPPAPGPAPTTIRPGYYSMREGRLLWIGS